MKKLSCFILCAAIFLSTISCSEVKETTETVSDETVEAVSDETTETVRYEIMVPGYKKLPAVIEKELFEKEILKPMYEATRFESVKLTFEEYLILKNSEDDSAQTLAMNAESFEFGRFFAFYTLLDPEDPALTEHDKQTIRTKYPITEEMAVYVFDSEARPLDKKYMEEYIMKYTDYEPAIVSYD